MAIWATSVLTKRPIIDDIARVFPATLELATAGDLSVGTLIGVPVGRLGRGAAGQAGRSGGARAGAGGLFGADLLARPAGSSGVLCQAAAGSRGRGGSTSPMNISISRITGLMLLDSRLQGQWDAFANAFSHIILPASLLGYFSMAYISRMTRSFMLAELGAGIYHHRAGQGRAGMAHHLGPCPAQCRRAAGDGDRAELMPICWKDRC